MKESLRKLRRRCENRGRETHTDFVGALRSRDDHASPFTPLNELPSPSQSFPWLSFQPFSNYGGLNCR
jgi:hypothetical protein